VSLAKRRSEEITRHRKRKYLTTTIRQALVQTHRASRETEDSVRRIAFGEDRLARPELNFVCELAKSSKLNRIQVSSPEKRKEGRAGHSPHLRA
jgi:hypothetical protein